MFRSRLELVAYMISAITDVPIEKCYNEALKYEDQPFIVRWTLD